MLTPLLVFRVLVVFRVLTTLGPILLGEDTLESLQLVVGSRVLVCAQANTANA